MIVAPAGSRLSQAGAGIEVAPSSRSSSRRERSAAGEDGGGGGLRRAHVEGHRKRLDSAGDVEHDGGARRAGRDGEAMQDGRDHARHVAAGDERDRRLDADSAAHEADERAPERLRVVDDADAGAQGSRDRRLDARRRDDDDVAGDRRDGLDRVVEQRTAVELGGQLVRPEARGAPAGQDDRR